MNITRYTFLILLLLAGIISCNKEENIDKEKPEIELSLEDAFPVNCDTLYFSEPFDFRVLFRDNAELGSYSLDIHNNFDHHSHSTEVTVCISDPVKSPENPFTFIEDFDIPRGSKELETNQTILIPAGNSNGSFDEGDYHFFISLTDKEGWSTQKGLSIKILYK